MARTIAIGEQDFARMMENHYFFVDKSDFIKDWWENGDPVTLIARPRRFGKTLMINMLADFFSVRRAGRSDLFEHLRIWQEEKYRKLQGTYPVISLSFASIKCGNYTETYEEICELIAREYRRQAFILEKDCFLESDKQQFYAIMNQKAKISTMRTSLNRLCEYLYNYYGKKVILLLDEYDTPMQEAYGNGYWKELTDFIRGLLNGSFKTNPYLERAVLTGITRVSRESVFSELNNLTAVTTTSRQYETAFGFTQEEVDQALKEYGLQAQAQEVKRWYDGFRFGGTDNIYNPWSITNFLKYREFKPYWANTGANQLAGDLIRRGSLQMKQIAEDLLQGGTFHTKLDEQIAFQQMDDTEEAVWSLLLASGYLKIAECRESDTEFTSDTPDEILYELAFTNLETRSAFRKMIHGWFSNSRYGYHDFLKALLAGDLDYMNTYMNQIALHTLSYFDCGTKPSGQAGPERFYHGFVLGLIVDLGGRYTITSNRESGFGRYDVLLKPLYPGDDGIVLEFKVYDPKKDTDLKAAADAGIRQILDKKYADMLETEGVPEEKIRIYGFAFEGKHVLIDGGALREMAGRCCHAKST